MTPSPKAPLPDGGALSFEVLGDVRAQTPVMLHRPLGGSMALWGEFATRLSRSFPLILFDPRGVGLSSPPPWGHSTRDMARDAIELLDFLGVMRAHIFGISLGGMVASWMAIDAPERVERLVLASTLPRALAMSQRVWHYVIPVMRAFLLPGAAAETAVLRQVLGPAFYRAHPERAAEINRLLRSAPTSHRSLLLLAVAAARHDASAFLNRIEAPTLLLFGDHDPIAARFACAQLTTEIAGSIVEIMPNAGHDLSLEQPLPLAERVADFLQGIPVKGQSDHQDY